MRLFAVVLVFIVNILFFQVGRRVFLLNCFKWIVIVALFFQLIIEIDSSGGCLSSLQVENGILTLVRPLLAERLHGS